jgi:hypothetical protein
MNHCDHLLLLLLLFLADCLFPVGNLEAFEARIQKMSAKELAVELAARKLKTGKSIYYHYMMINA